MEYEVESELTSRISTIILMPNSPPSDAMACVREGQQLVKRGMIEEAVGFFLYATAIVHRFPYAMLELNYFSDEYYKAGVWANNKGSKQQAIWYLVAAIEFNPENEKARELLNTIEAAIHRPDTTRTCYVFYDAKRADAVHREAVRRCLEFTSIAGVIGDIMEFGVLGGWSARIFAETMRDVMVMGNLHLFDSFEGLPEYSSVVDQQSFEIMGRNIWVDKMKFPDEFVASIGGSLERQIHNNLSYIIRNERIKLHRGFYQESLKRPLKVKAALIHIDCDLYQSTVDVLWGLYHLDVLQDGCVVMFDDWNCNKANPNFGERRAFHEFLANQDRFTASNFFTYGFNGAVFILHENIRR